MLLRATFGAHLVISGELKEEVRNSLGELDGETPDLVQEFTGNRGVGAENRFYPHF